MELKQTSGKEPLLHLLVSLYWKEGLSENGPRFLRIVVQLADPMVSEVRRYDKADS